MDADLPDPVEVVKLHADYHLEFHAVVPYRECEHAARAEIRRLAGELGIYYSPLSDNEYTYPSWWEPSVNMVDRAMPIEKFVRALYFDSGESQLGYLTAKPSTQLYTYNDPAIVAGPLEPVQLIHRMIVRGHLQRAVDKLYPPPR